MYPICIFQETITTINSSSGHLLLSRTCRLKPLQNVIKFRFYHLDVPFLTSNRYFLPNITWIHIMYKELNKVAEGQAAP